MDDAIWEVTVFTKIWQRLLGADIAQAFFQAMLQQARERSLLFSSSNPASPSGEMFSIRTFASPQHTVHRTTIIRYSF
jgi:hypothetical protein